MSTTQDLTQPPNPVSFWEAVMYWLKLGFISFGGPAGQISMMHQELVEKRRWISEGRFLHALNYTMVLPGPEAQQLATYIGWLMHGVRGGMVAGVLFVLPSLFILIALTWAYLAFGEVPAVAGILYGIKPAVTAIILFAAYRIGSKALPNLVLKGMALAAFIAIAVFDVYFPIIIIVAGLFAAIGARFSVETFKAGGHHGSGEEVPHGVALIDDDTPTPEHVKFKWSRVLSILAVGLVLGGGVMVYLYVQYGWQGTLTQMGYFFTKAALLTIGGAYAVLPYISLGGVEHEWIDKTQMLDGLALGETTPGPLVMVNAFVGFVGGWTNEIFGTGSQLLSGIVAASVVTFFTFLPSFLFIFLGAPAIEATRNDLKFTAPLTGITAAVVGVILNLAVFFTYHVLWPEDAGFQGTFEWFSALIGIAAMIALFKYNVGVVTVIAASAVIGLGYSLAIL